MNGSTNEFDRAGFLRVLAGIGCISAALLMIELALTRIFSVTMYYHFAFLAISIALFGLSASGVYVYVARKPLSGRPTATLLAVHSLLFAAVTVGALAALVRIRVGLNYSQSNLVKMIAQLGGYLNRKHDGPPGPQTMWIGLQRMRDFAAAWSAFGPGEARKDV